MINDNRREQLAMQADFSASQQLLMSLPRWFSAHNRVCSDLMVGGSGGDGGGKGKVLILNVDRFSVWN